LLCFRYYRAWQEDGFFYLQLELCALGSLRDLQKSGCLPLAVNVIWSYLAQVRRSLLPSAHRE
jgi:hypothetical protein